MKNNHKLKRTIILVMLLIAGANTRSAAQALLSYTQYADNLTPLNPAYSALDKAGSVQVLGRTQFVGVQGAPHTFLFNASLPLPGIGSTAGVFVVNDQLAVEKLTEVNAFFAKSIQLTASSHLAVSVNGGMRNYQANYSSLDNNDPEFRNDIRKNSPAVGFGVLLYSDKYYVGASMPSLALGKANMLGQPDYLKSRYYLSGAFIMPLTGDIKLKPAALVYSSANTRMVANVSGTFYLQEKLGVGLNYSSSKLISGILSMTMGNFKGGYSYEFGASGNNRGGLNNATSEINLAYRFGKNPGPRML